MRITVPKLKQFNITLTPELDAKIDDLAKRWRMERSKIGADIIDTFIEHWDALQETLLETKTLFKQEVRQIVERPGIVKGNAKSTPNLGRKKRP